jgi:hypothetical protein
LITLAQAMAAIKPAGISFDSIYIEDNKRPPSTTIVCPVR